MRYEFSKEDEDFRQELRSWIRDEIPGEFKDWQGVDEAADGFNGWFNSWFNGGFCSRFDGNCRGGFWLGCC